MTEALKNRPIGVVPFLKWAGGKQWLVPLVKPLLTLRLHSVDCNYFEPFLGGGSLFFALLPQNARLSDSNRELIETYQAVQRDVSAVIRCLRTYAYTKECYYKTRGLQPTSPAQRAARFIYLNRTCWNGLYRVNRQGTFNVPIGSFAYDPDIIMADRLRTAERALKGAQIAWKDFEEACEHAGSGDVVYLDPPYTVAHGKNGFLRYNEQVFSWTDQKRLAGLARRLKDAGCHTIVTNAAHPSILRLYPQFSIRRVLRKSLVAGEKTKRRQVAELLITSFAPKT